MCNISTFFVCKINYNTYRSLLLKTLKKKLTILFLKQKGFCLGNENLLFYNLEVIFLFLFLSFSFILYKILDFVYVMIIVKLNCLTFRKKSLKVKNHSLKQ